VGESRPGDAVARDGDARVVSEASLWDPRTGTDRPPADNRLRPLWISPTLLGPDRAWSTVDWGALGEVGWWDDLGHRLRLAVHESRTTLPGLGRTRACALSNRALPQGSDWQPAARQKSTRSGRTTLPIAAIQERKSNGMDPSPLYGIECQTGVVW